VERRPDLATARTVDDTGLFDAPMYWVLDYDLLPTAAPRHARPAD
jgi:hypothetical protein